VARVKQTDRAEARRRYRQATSQEAAIDGAADDVPAESGDGRTDAARAARPTRQAPAKPAGSKQQPAARPGITTAFRAAYHPAHVREDVAALPKLLLHWALLAPIGMILAGGVIAFVFRSYSGGALAYQLLVLPGTGFGLPQLVAGFFAPRASYLLGFVVSLVQGVVGTIFILLIASQTGSPFPSDQLPTLLIQSFIFGPISGTLFAAAAAWYRRFLALSGPKRTATNTRSQSRSSNRGGSRR
jgi:hypothetical protein